MELKKVIVIGTGTMGQGIAQWFLQQHLDVEMVDSNHDFAKKSHAKILEQLDTLASRGKLSADDVAKFKPRLNVVTLEQVDPNSDLVVEAIIEDLEVKKDLFKKLDELMSDKTIIA